MIGNRISVEGSILLEEEAARAELLGCLTDRQLAIIVKEGLFKIFVPKSLGGLEMELPEALRLEEQLAYLDGSLGWTVTLCSGASWFAGFMDPSVASEVFSDEAVCFGGSGMASGIAAVQPKGYLINGCWKYATGAPHTTVFTANCRVEDEGRPVLDNEGNPLVRAFYFYRDEVELLEDWDTMGLKATASHSFRVKDCRVGPERCFMIDPARATIDRPIYRYPFLQFAEVTLAANYLGMFRRFIDLGLEKTSFLHGEAFREAQASLNVHAAGFYRVADASWDLLKQSGSIPPSLLQEISGVCKKMVREGYVAISGLYPKTGMQGAMQSHPINRVWRDIHTASQHMIFR